MNTVDIARRSGGRCSAALRKLSTPWTSRLIARLCPSDNGAITRANPLSVQRLRLWKRANICVSGRPDWLFIKLHCHGMDPLQQEAVVGTPMRQFLCDLVKGAQERGETLHFVSAREMVNVVLAACDGRELFSGEAAEQP